MYLLYKCLSPYVSCLLCIAKIKSGKEVKLIIRVLLGTKSILFFVALTSFIASYIISPKIAKYCEQALLLITPSLATVVGKNLWSWVAWMAMCNQWNCQLRIHTNTRYWLRSGILFGFGDLNQSKSFLV